MRATWQRVYQLTHLVFTRLNFLATKSMIVAAHEVANLSDCAFLIVVHF